MSKLPAVPRERPIVAMLCGLPASGKTLLAHELERELEAVRFSVDEWMIRLYGHHMPRDLFHERLGMLKELHWGLARRIVELGRSVVLDYGFWRREERMLFGRLANEAGALPVVYYLDRPLETLLQRVARRNSELPEGTYEVTAEMMELFAGWFESPSEDEGMTLLQL